MSIHFPPPKEAASLYRGGVMHARMKPVEHRFSYEVFSLLIDLDRLAEASRASVFFSVGRWNLLSFWQKDHGPRDGSSLRVYVDRILAEAGLSLPGGRVLLLCYPRIAGMGFNPLSVYFAYAADGELAAAIYEVRNTFGEHHTYVCPVAPGELGPEGLRQERRKLFYVSPFNDLDMRYRFRVRPPGDTIAVRILETDDQGPLLAATFQGKRRHLTTSSLLAALARIPALTLTVIGGIHWEALRLWLKGMRLVKRPPAPPPLSYGDRMVGFDTVARPPESGAQEFGAHDTGANGFAPSTARP
ncbi:DUF1365 domain-containing protein [Alsobacter metallidurans]|uniref:DUF1365 domain-containing protein n=1 Tax=Alsobacter metallidurans TaxID=340221 RepID=A0A917I8I7_9HYPH|nr:DUF1365 domain-containing protein [Alsobacter metallidurans]GGH22602.1 DUF1365 domain-containing protein [Alsobacter metallidurans]